MQLHPCQLSNVLLGLWLCGLLVVLCYMVLEIYVYIVFIAVGYFTYRYLLDAINKRIVSDGRGVLVTGCDTGFGHATALRLDQLGFTVFAGCLLPDGEGTRTLRQTGSKRMHVLHLDVTRDEHVKKALEYVQLNCSNAGLWAVINNAAILSAGDAELATIDVINKVFDVNLYGMIRVTQTFIPMLRKTAGRVVNVSSVRGRAALPFNCIYTMAKFAVEAFSDTLRREMHRFGVKVVIIEPGNFAGVTGIISSKNIKCVEKDLVAMWNAASPETKAAYGEQYLDQILGSFQAFRDTGGPSAGPVVDAMVDAVTSAVPNCRYLVPGTRKLLDWYTVAVYLDAYLPERISDFLVRVFDPPPPVKFTVPQTQ